MVYNVNNTVVVKLTKRGANVLNEYLREFYKNGDKPWKEGDTYFGELWHVMEIFGQHFEDYEGEGPLFYHNEISIENE